MKNPVCPQCGTKLTPVEQSPLSSLNADQFDAVKAGDYFCPRCPSNHRGIAPHCYWWTNELPEVHEYTI